MPEIASSLALWPGVLLVAGGLAKAADVSRGDVRDTVLGRLIGRPRRLHTIWALVAAAELSVGILVVAGLVVPWPEVAAAVLLSGATLLAVWGLRHAPDAGCGCFGARTTAPVSVRTTARAGFLAVLAGLAALGGASWASVLDHPAAAAAILAAGLALAWLSPELPALGELAAAGLGRASLPARLVRDATCSRRISLERSVARLRGSDLWQRARPYVSTEAPTEHWDEGCWRLLCYPAVYEGEPATAVFAVSLGLRRSRDRVAFVDEAEQRILGRLEAGRSRE